MTAILTTVLQLSTIQKRRQSKYTFNVLRLKKTVTRELYIQLVFQSRARSIQTLSVKGRENLLHTAFAVRNTRSILRE